MTAHEIAQALALELGGGVTRSSGQILCRCPCHADRGPSLAVRDSEIGPLVHCHAGCPQATVIDELKRRGLWPTHDRRMPVLQHARMAPAAAKPDDAARIGYARDIWCASVDPRGTLAQRYLEARGLELDDDLRLRVLRFHPRCPFGRDEAGNRRSVPALLAAFRPLRNDVASENEPNAIHRIGLKPDGSKIDKLMLGPTGGCAVKIDDDEIVLEGLAICEGIETAIAIRARRHSQQIQCAPVWALGSAGAIARLEPIPGIEALHVFADHDPTGLEAATECAQRWADAGLEAIVRHLNKQGADYADA